jgi:hypothetical protein
VDDVSGFAKPFFHGLNSGLTGAPLFVSRKSIEVSVGVSSGVDEVLFTLERLWRSRAARHEKVIEPETTISPKSRNKEKLECLLRSANMNEDSGIFVTWLIHYPMSLAFW